MRLLNVRRFAALLASCIPLAAGASALGRLQVVVPFAVMQELGERLSGSEVCVIDGAAHSAYFSHPQIFNSAVLDFLARRYR